MQQRGLPEVWPAFCFMFTKTGSSRTIVILKVNLYLTAKLTPGRLSQISQNVTVKDSLSLLDIIIHYSYSCSKSLWCNMELLTAVKLP